MVHQWLTRKRPIIFWLMSNPDQLSQIPGRAYHIPELLRLSPLISRVSPAFYGRRDEPEDEHKRRTIPLLWHLAHGIVHQPLLLQ